MPALTSGQGRHEVFAQEYIVDLNGTQAAIRAGYSPRTAHVQASKLLKDPKIAARIEELKAERSARTRIDADWVLERLAQEAEADVADLYDEDGDLKPVREWPKIWRQGLVAGMDIQSFQEGDFPTRIAKLRLSDRTARLKMIGDHVAVGAFKQQLEVTDKTETPEQWLMRKARERAAS